jgi:HK97 family phage portal protein
MSLFSALVGGPIEKRTVDASALTWSVLAGNPPSKSGQNVNVWTALRVATVLACVRVLAEGIAQLPKKLLQDKGDRTAPAVDHPLYTVLARRPNSWMTPFEFFETLTAHALLDKGGFAYIGRVGGQVDELIPVIPSSVTVRYPRGMAGEVTYGITLLSGETFDLPRSEVLHIRGLSWDSYVGLQSIQLAREAIGLAISSEETQAKLHGNGARPGGILTTDSTLKKPAKDELRKEWQEKFGTSANAFGTAVLDSGFKFQSLAMTGVDAQHLETRKHQIEEICRAFMVHPQMVFHSDKTSTHASAEQFSLDFVKYGLGPWIARWEQAIDRDLLTAEEQAKGYYSHMEVKGLLRGDHKALGEYYRASLGSASAPGWNCPNDIRRLEDQDPIDAPGMDDVVTVKDLSGKAVPPTDPASTAEADAAAAAKAHERAVELAWVQGVATGKALDPLRPLQSKPPPKVTILRDAQGRAIGLKPEG